MAGAHISGATCEQRENHSGAQYSGNPSHLAVSGWIVRCLRFELSACEGHATEMSAEQTPDKTIADVCSTLDRGIASLLVGSETTHHTWRVDSEAVSGTPQGPLTSQ